METELTARVPTLRLPRLGSPPPIWRETRFGLELASLRRSPIYRGDGVSNAGGQPVILIPGFLAGDDSLGIMTKWLRRTGHRTSSASMRANIDCSEAAVSRIERRAEALAERQGERVAVVGQSRGGTFARVLARRRPDLVSGIVTLGTPHVDPLAIHPLVHLQLIAIGALGTLRVPGLMKYSCLHGDCCEPFWEDLQGALPRGVGYTSVYSKTDGIVDWRSCLDPAAEHVEIDSSHVGMANHPEAYRAVSLALTDFRRRDRRAQRRREASGGSRSAAAA